MPSAQYTFLYHDSMSGLLDQVNEFCRKYPEYRMMQVLVSGSRVAAILTTDGN